MNEQLQAKLVEILAGIQSATKVAGDFALEQLPDIAQQYVAYGRAVHTASLAVGLLIAFLIFLGRKQLKAGMDDFEMWPVFVLMLGGLGSLFAVMFNAGPFFLVWLAPKVWLLKEIAGLIK